MGEERPYITLTVDVADPVAIDDFISLFAGLGDQFERYVRSQNPMLRAEGKFYVREVRHGSIEADLLPLFDNIISLMDSVLIVTGFGNFVARVLKGYAAGQRYPGASRSDLRDYLGTVRAIAKDKDGKATLTTAVYKEGLLNREVVFKFSTQEARAAREQIEQHALELEAGDAQIHERVLMHFKRPDVGPAGVGKRTGERVIIPEISKRDLPLFYASALTEDKIKSILREDDRNIFKLAFVVDVSVQTRNDRAIAYRITDLHKVLEIDDDLGF